MHDDSTFRTESTWQDDEEVTIRDAIAPVSSLRLMQFGAYNRLLQVSVMRQGFTEPKGFAILDPDGVRELRANCSRWLARWDEEAQDGDD